MTTRLAMRRTTLINLALFSSPACLYAQGLSFPKNPPGYGRHDPIGIVLDPAHFGRKADASPAFFRLPAALAGMGLEPLSALNHAWSEPPVAIIGIFQSGGRLLDFGRPYQHVAIYEIDREVVELIKQDVRYQDAAKRGCAIEFLMGDPRLTLERADEIASSTRGWAERLPSRKGYYETIIVDAVSPDSIPVHLLTRDAFEVYLEHTTKNGIVAVHCTNRIVELVLPVVDGAVSLKLTYRLTREKMGKDTLEWMFLSRQETRLPTKDQLKVNVELRTPKASNRRVWLDDYSNILELLRDRGSEKGK